MNFESLPREVLLRVFQHAGDNQREVLRYSSISKSLLAVVRQAALHCIRLKTAEDLAVYARLMVKNSPLESPMATKILEIRWHMATRTTHSTRNSNIGSLLEPMVVRWHPALVSLDVICPHTLEDAEELVETLMQLRHLRVLAFSRSAAVRQFEWQHVQRILDAGSLQHLTVTDAVEPNSTILCEQRYPTLLSLSLSVEIDAASLRNILATVPNLQRLHLSMIPPPGSSDTVDPWAGTLENLRSFSAYRCGYNLDEREAAGIRTLEQLLSNSKRLEDLRLAFVHHPRADGFLWSIKAPLRILAMPLTGVTWSGAVAWMAKQEKLRGESPELTTLRLVSHDDWALAPEDRAKVEVCTEGPQKRGDLKLSSRQRPWTSDANSPSTSGSDSRRTCWPLVLPGTACKGTFASFWLIVSRSVGSSRGQPAMFYVQCTVSSSSF
jgi:hypothetical protein